jgi:hypothetical protein
MILRSEEESVSLDVRTVVFHQPHHPLRNLRLKNLASSQIRADDGAPLPMMQGLFYQAEELAFELDDVVHQRGPDEANLDDGADRRLDCDP